MKNLLALLLFIPLLAQANIAQTVIDSPNTFAFCKTVDVSTTAYALHTGRFYEANPVIRTVLSHGYVPLIGISVGIWYLLEKMHNKAATEGVNAVTCGIAAHNIFLLTK